MHGRRDQTVRDVLGKAEESGIREQLCMWSMERLTQKLLLSSRWGPCRPQSQLGPVLYDKTVHISGSALSACCVISPNATESYHLPMLGKWTRLREAFGLGPFTAPPNCLAV